jgi:hypothetical protein
MSTLTGTKIKDTYPSLLKLINNGSLQTSIPTIISDGLGNVTPLQIAETRIQTQYSASTIGLDLSFTNNKFTIGDYDNTANGISVQVNDTSNSVFIGYNAPFGSGISYIKMAAGPSNSFATFLGANVSGGNSIMQNYFSGTNDITLTSNNAFIKIDGVANNTNITTDTIEFNGAGLENPTPPANPNPVTYLIVTVNGLQYKIGLLNP